MLKKIVTNNKQQTTNNNKNRTGKAITTTFLVAGGLAFFQEPQFHDAVKIGYGIASAAVVGLSTSIGAKVGAKVGVIVGGLAGAVLGGGVGATTGDSDNMVTGVGCGGCFGAATFGIGGWIAGMVLSYNISKTHVSDWMKDRNEMHQEQLDGFKKEAKDAVSIGRNEMNITYSQALTM